MKNNLGFMLFVAVAVVFVGCAPKEARTVRRNGVWAEDGSELLLMEAQWISKDPDSPYYDDTSGSERAIVFLRAKPDLSGATEIGRIEDADTLGAGGGALYHPLFWLKSAGKIIGLQYGNPFIYDSVAATYHEPAIPSSRVAAHFGADITDASGLVHDYAPSPDGGVLAVFYILAYQPAGGTIFDIAYVHAVGFFDIATAAYMGSTALELWRGISDNLVFYPPVADVGLTPPTPPTIPTLAVLTFPITFIWSKDSSGVYVVNKANDVGETHAAVFVAAPTAPLPSTPVVTPLSLTDTVPELAIQTSHGPVSPTGEALVVYEETRNGEIAVDLRVMQATGWIAYGDGGVIPLSQLNYGQ